jgi:hypothetical protein
MMRASSISRWGKGDPKGYLEIMAADATDFDLHGDDGILTFNLVNYRPEADGSERAFVGWNSTEVYGRMNNQWRTLHSHWSSVKPDVKPSMSELQ